MKNIDDIIKNKVIPNLRDQFSAAKPVLLTGSGFSVDASNITGERLPIGNQFAETIYSLCNPDDVYDQSSLKDCFQQALTQKKNKLGELLVKTFTVDPKSLPNWYKDVFCLPWVKHYTLNIDNLCEASLSRFEFERAFTFSNASERKEIAQPGWNLETIYLHGKAIDDPSNVTFSNSQYALKQAYNDPYYAALAGDLVSRPFVIIGTPIDESPLWQYLEMRKGRGKRGTLELRPASYLVSPQLSKAREAILAEMNIHWLPMTGQEFTEQILSKLSEAKEKGLQFLRDRKDYSNRTARLPLVSELPKKPEKSSLYLLGYEPIWDDIISGRAIKRDEDDRIYKHLPVWAKKKEKKRFVIITGTAGSGKTTSLMRLSLALESDGLRVAWLDDEIDLDLNSLPRDFNKSSHADVLAIDDADRFGKRLSTLIKELMESENPPLIVMTIRSHRVDSAINDVILKNFRQVEFTMPNLSENEIESLIEVLDKDNKLGKLKGMNDVQRKQAFKKQAQSQLLIAMVQATSGEKFDVKICDELEKLTPDQKKLYSLISVSHYLKYRPTKPDLLIAINDNSNTYLAALKVLADRKIVKTTGEVEKRYSTRHKYIAETLFKSLKTSGTIQDSFTSLGHLAAISAGPNPRNSNPYGRLLIKILNHDNLVDLIGIPSSRNLYGQLEDLLRDSYQYWLQRGSFELDHGKLELAQNYLDQSLSLEPSNRMINNTYCLLKMKKSISSPNEISSKTVATETIDELKERIKQTGGSDEYPFHILGSQGIKWMTASKMTGDESKKFLTELVKVVGVGYKTHGGKRLKELDTQLQHELLYLAVKKD